MEIRHNLGREITNAELKTSLAEQYPGMDVSINEKTGVIEIRYRTRTGEAATDQAELDRLAIRERREGMVDAVRPAMGARAAFATQSGIDAFPRAAVQLKV